MFHHEGTLEEFLSYFPAQKEPRIEPDIGLVIHLWDYGTDDHGRPMPERDFSILEIEKHLKFRITPESIWRG